MKSGRPGRAGCRRHPVIPASRNNFTSASSVALFPRARTVAMMRERSRLLTLSATRKLCRRTKISARILSARPNNPPDARSSPVADN
jgi:hypothetical protein